MKYPIRTMNNQASVFPTFTNSNASISYTEQEISCIALRKCVNEVIADVLSATDEKSDIILNNVPPEMLVSTQKDILASVLSCMLITTIINGKNNFLHISAKTVGNITLMHIRNSHAGYNDHIAASMQTIEMLAEALGGCVSISNNFVHGLTLAFTFINH
jgi:hypothetical protein